MKLKSNTILITGGASGIGYELTRQLTALGNKILITGRDQAKMDRAKAAFPKIHTFQSDVSDPEAIATLYEKVTKQFPDLNILINNAGIMRAINVHDRAGGLEDITREIEINLNGPIRMVKQFLPHLKTKSEAAIMNVSSGLAFVPLPISPVYCATKAGLHSFTESLRVQLRNTKVKVFDLAPPATQTELLDGFNVEDMKGASIMKVEDMVKVAVKGMQTDRFEIRPGQANQLKMMNRLAPGFILKQMSRSVDRMLRTQNYSKYRAAYLGHVYCFGALSYLGSNQGRQRRLPNGRGSCGLFGSQQRENERWVNYKGKWLSLLELRKVSASPQQNSSSVRAPMFSLLAVVTRSLKKP